MARWNSKFTRNPRFYCTYGGKYGNITCKDVKSPFECELEKIVLTGIKDIIARTGSEKKFGKSPEREDSEKRIAELNAKIKALDAEKMRRYESYTLGECSKEEFLKHKGEIIDKIRKLETQADKPFKTKEITSQIDSARLSFASGEEMEELLDCTPGSASIMGLMNDKDGRVRLLVDIDILSGEYLGCHPCINTSSLKLKTSDVFDRFIKAVNHDMTVVELVGE